VADLVLLRICSSDRIIWT